MKKIILYSFVVLLIIAIIGYFYPINIQVATVDTNTDHTVSPIDLAVATELFRKNNIDMGTLAISSVSRDDSGATHVKSNQFYKGLPIFYSDIIYHFDITGKASDRSNIDGTSTIYFSGYRIDDLSISIKPTLSAGSAARTARQKMGPSFFFKAELGVVNLNGGSGNPMPNFALIWRIKPKGAEEYTFAEVDANTGKLIFYDDGLRY